MAGCTDFAAVNENKVARLGDEMQVEGLLWLDAPKCLRNISCEKNQQIQKFDDVFDTSGISTLNQKISKAATINDLAELSDYSGLEFPNELKNVSLETIIAHYEKNIKWSSREIDMLLKNDSETYLNVINRFGSFPAAIKHTETDFNQFKSSTLNKYSIRQKAEIENFYSDDYYSAIRAYQDYIKGSVISPIKQAKDLIGENLKSAKGGPGPTDDPNPEDPDNILGYKLIVINNNWVMWWTYYTDGTRTKHKGSAINTTYPGF